jgi:peptidyl-tRNA hydrolase
MKAALRSSQSQGWHFGNPIEKYKMTRHSVAELDQVIALSNASANLLSALGSNDNLLNDFGTQSSVHQLAVALSAEALAILKPNGEIADSEISGLNYPRFS